MRMGKTLFWKVLCPFNESVTFSDNPHDNATPKDIPDSNSGILGLSNDVLFVSGFFWKGD